MYCNFNHNPFTLAACILKVLPSFPLIFTYLNYYILFPWLQYIHFCGIDLYVHPSPAVFAHNHQATQVHISAPPPCDKDPPMWLLFREPTLDQTEHVHPSGRTEDFYMYRKLHTYTDSDNPGRYMSDPRWYSHPPLFPIYTWHSRTYDIPKIWWSPSSLSPLGVLSLGNHLLSQPSCLLYTSPRPRD